MKKLLLHPRAFVLFFLLFFSLTLFAQSNASWTAEAFGENDFVENKGQFDKMNGTGADILFGATGSSVDVYFSSKGLTYRYDDWVVMTEEEKEEYVKPSTKG